MATQIQVAEEKDYVIRAREIFIRISLLAIVAVTCFLILKPFIGLIAWSAIIAIAVYPACKRLTQLLGGREKWAAVFCTVILLAAIIVPMLLLAGTLSDGITHITARVKSGELSVPPPPPKLEQWPVIGAPLNNLWMLASTNLTGLLNRFSPQIQKALPTVLSASAQLGMSFLQFVFSILLSGYLLANWRSYAPLSNTFLQRVFGPSGADFSELITATVRSVTNGVLGVAAIQSVALGLGMLVAGLPGAGMWAALYLVAASLQFGPLVMLPAVAFGFLKLGTGSFVVYLVWCMIVGLMDNVLKPLLLGRAGKVPTLVIFLGVVGGFIAMGIIGLFAGAIILSVGYKLLLAVLEEQKPVPA